MRQDNAFRPINLIKIIQVVYQTHFGRANLSQILIKTCDAFLMNTSMSCMSAFGSQIQTMIRLSHCTIQSVIKQVRLPSQRVNVYLTCSQQFEKRCPICISLHLRKSTRLKQPQIKCVSLYQHLDYTTQILFVSSSIQKIQTWMCHANLTLMFQMSMETV